MQKALVPFDVAGANVPKVEFDYNSSNATLQSFNGSPG